MKQSVFFLAVALILFDSWLVQLPAQANGSANNSKAGKESEKQQAALKAAGEEDQESAAPEAVEIKVAALQSMDLYRSVFYGSRLRPQNRYPQRAPITGTLEDVAVAAGEQVSRGQLL